VSAISKANPGVVSTRLQIGQKLRIPAAAASGGAGAPSGGAAEKSQSYTVKSGDDVYNSTKRAPSNLASLMPVWNDPDTWNLDALSPYIDNGIQIGIGGFFYVLPRPTYAAWLQDDWAITNNLTLNLGLRYEVETPLVERDVFNHSLFILRTDVIDGDFQQKSIL
jgi:hypothetical protein